MREATFFPKLRTGVVDFFRHGRGAAVQLVGTALALTAVSTALLVDTAGVRLRRDVARLVLEDRLEVLESARWRVAWPGRSGCCATWKARRSRRATGPTW